MRLAIAFLIFSLMLIAPVQGQNGKVDIGVTTAGVEISEGDTIWVDEESSFDIYFENEDTVAGYSTGFIIWSDNGTDWQWNEKIFDIVYIPPTMPPEFETTYAVVTPVAGSRQYPHSVVWDNGGLNISLNDVDGPPMDTLLFGGTRKTHGLYPGPLEKQIQIHFTATQPTSGFVSTLCIDSAKVGAAGDFVFSDVAGSTYPPVTLWSEGGRCYPVKKEGAASPPTIVLNPTQIGVTGIIGSYTPSASISVSNGGIGTMTWTATNGESWLSLNPDNGVDNGTINLVFDLTGLDVGLYYDTVVVSSPEAYNSPQKVPVTLTVDKLPPVIEYEPLQFYLSAVVGGANPADEYLHIWNDVPGNVLTWSVTNSSSWLNLTPTTGESHDSVTLQFDISSLAYGIYYDTIVIADPEATNSPQRVPVTLQMVSDLPVLAFDPDTLHVLVPLGTIMDPVPVTVYNDGEGTMTYQAAESCSWITGIIPNSGTAPQEVAIDLKTFSLGAGDYYCNVTFTSPEAINSPQDLVVHLHVTADPAMINLIPNPVNIDRYECWQGPTDLLPPDDEKASYFFQVMNTGSDPMNWWLTHTADWCVPSTTSGTDFSVVRLTLKMTNSFAAGTYVDTFVVYSNDALNSPETLLVNLNIFESPETPEIVVTDSVVTIPAQEVFGPIGPFFPITTVYNGNPGCMNFTIENDNPWLHFLDTLFSAPDEVVGLVEIGGYTYGLYEDEIFIHSDASNSPVRIRLNLIVWRYRGDVNWDNRVNIADVVYLLNMVFHFGPPPYPELRVGDVNCDGNVNLPDAVYLINQIFHYGPVPCGTPKSGEF